MTTMLNIMRESLCLARSLPSRPFQQAVESLQLAFYLIKNSA